MGLDSSADVLTGLVAGEAAAAAGFSAGAADVDGFSLSLVAAARLTCVADRKRLRINDDGEPWTDRKRKREYIVAIEWSSDLQKRTDECHSRMEPTRIDLPEIS